MTCPSRRGRGNLAIADLESTNGPIRRHGLYALGVTAELKQLDALLRRSSALADHLEVALQLPPFEEGARFRASTLAGSLALEHGEGVRALLAL